MTFDNYIDTVVGAFERRLQQILPEVQGRILDRLRRDLEIDGEGRIAMTPANVRALGRLDTLFAEQMKKLGYNELVDAFVAQFPNQIPFFQEALDQISKRLKTPLPPVDFGPTDLRLFGAQQIATGTLLDDVILRAGEAAKRQALFSVGGLSFSKLTTEMAQQFNRSVSECAGLAATSTSTFYRMVAERGYQHIQADLPEEILHFKFEGPNDKVTRPFCERLLEGGRSYTRAQIDAMDNGQIPNVFVSAGGFNCRHQWVLIGTVPAEV